jgi:hypothetical protein
MTRCPPPHFHALYVEHEALIDIQTLAVITGSLPRRALAFMLEWAQATRTDGGLDAVPAEAAAQDDRAASVTPAVRPTAPWRVQTVKALPNDRLFVRLV